MRIILILIFLICGFVSENILAQEAKQMAKKPPLAPDTNYITSYPDLLTIGLYTATPIMQLTIKPVEKEQEKYKSDFRGNFSDQVGLTFAYKKISLQFGIKTPFGPGRNDDKGRTKSLGITVRVRKPNYILEAQYRRYLGYYDNNSPSYVPSDTVSVRPDIQFNNVGVNGIYNFSWKKYSYNAPLTFNDRQLKSRIGLVSKVGINYMSISSSDSTLLSSVQASGFSEFDDIRAINAILLKAGPGVGLNLVVFKRFYLALNGFLMGNLIGYTYDVKDKERSPWGFNTNFYTETTFGFGYNSKRIFAGASFNGDINIMKIRSANIRTNFATIFITVGYRFNAPDFLKKNYKKVKILNKD